MLALCAPASADSVAFTGAGAAGTFGLGNYTGVVSYTAGPLSTTGTLTIMLTNTSDPGNAGAITGFLFNIGSGDPNATATLDPGVDPFVQATGGYLEPGVFGGGTFDAGAELSPALLETDGPAPGIGVGETGSFNFQVSAADASQLTAMSFLEGGELEFNFLVLFEGFNSGGGDVVAAGVAMVPLPPPVTLGAVGLLGVIVVSTRFRRIVRVG
jgi:hypothetical protein